MNKDVKVKCIKELSPFIKGREYYSDSSIFMNNTDFKEKQVFVIESKNNDNTDNVYSILIDVFLKHFKEAK